MKVYKTNQIRNIALAGHVGSGKTMLTEAMLYMAGQIERPGSVEAGTTFSDYDPEEIRHKHSIQACVIPVEHAEHKINLIDLPGARDFVGEIKRGLRAADAMMLVLDATSGVDTGAEFAWQYAEELKLPCVIFINKMDKDKADYGRTIEAVREHLHARLVRLAIPVGSGEEFQGVIDLLRMKKVKTDGNKVTYIDIPEHLAEEARLAHHELVEVAAEGDDDLMTKYLEEGSLTQEEVLKGLAEDIAERRVVPVLCGSATLDLGIRPTLDLIAECMPDPTFHEGYTSVDAKGGEPQPFTVTPEGSALLWVFKTVIDPYAGKLSLFKVMRGTVRGEAALENINQGKSERVAHLLCARGRKTEEVPELHAGDIGAAAKLELTHTGETLGEPGTGMRIGETELPKRTTFRAIKARSRADEDKIGMAFHRLIEQDPSLSYFRDPAIGQTILAGHGEAHLNVAVARLKDMPKLEVDLEVPEVPYRETITRAAEGQGKHKKQSGGHGQYGDCWIRFEPLPEGSGFQFEWKIVGGVIPTNFQGAIEKGLHEALGHGVLAGKQTVDLKASCYDGSFHAVDSSEQAFKTAASIAFKNVLPQCGPVLLEPIYKLDITIPEEYMGDVMGDLNSRRGRILGMDTRGGKQTIAAQIPLAEAYTYGRQLNAITQGRGVFEMDFDHYDRAPADVQEKVAAAARANGNGRA